jgi:DNA-binding NarL/FixJ family response regulator
MIPSSYHDGFMSKGGDGLASHAVELSRTTVAVIDDSERVLKAVSRQLCSIGFAKPFLADTYDAGLETITRRKPDVALVDIHLDDGKDGLELIREVREKGFRGKAVVFTGDGAPELYMRAAMTGANDFIVKSPRIDVGKELVRVLAEPTAEPDASWVTRSVNDVAYLRTIGVTNREREILGQWAKLAFPPMKILADHVGKAEGQVRKMFCDVYTKLGVENRNIAELAHIITVGALFPAAK